MPEGMTAMEGRIESPVVALTPPPPAEVPSSDHRSLWASASAGGRRSKRQIAAAERSARTCFRKRRDELMEILLSETIPLMQIT